MISSIPLILDLGTKMSDPHVEVYVVFWAPTKYALIRPNSP